MRKVFDEAIGFWLWLREDLGLSRSGRVVFTVVLVVGVAGGIGDVLSSSPHADQAGAVLMVFVAVVLAAIVCLDAAFRGMARHRAARNSRP